MTALLSKESRIRFAAVNCHENIWISKRGDSSAVFHQHPRHSQYLTSPLTKSCRLATTLPIHLPLKLFWKPIQHRFRGWDTLTMQQFSPYIRGTILWISVPQNEPAGRRWLPHWCQDVVLQERLCVRALLRQFLIILCAKLCRQQKMAEAVVL